jgi:hypothetical protein
MITPDKAEFQMPADPDVDWRWTETNFWPFCIPEARISGSLYLFAKPKLGVCMSDITVQDRIVSAWEDQIYVDNAQHLPCPQSLLDYELPNGLKVKAVEPNKHYEIDYVGIDDTEMHLEFNALGDPWDINDPETDPLAHTRIGAGWDKAFSGHYELTGRITGEARIRGTTYAVDCIDTADRSWGVRDDRSVTNITWLHGSFGEDLTLHAMAFIDPAHDENFGDLISGYVLENGTAYGLVEITGRSKRRGMYAMSSVIEVVDVRGQRYEITGSTLNAGPLGPWPAVIYVQHFMRWNCAGKIGYGVQTDGVTRAYATRYRDLLATGTGAPAAR